MQFYVSIGDLNSFAKEFWHKLSNYTIFAFHGEMGAGKTTIITALYGFKGVKEAMSSPTYSIINEYTIEGKEPVEHFYHIDLYRLELLDEIIQTGIEEILESGEVCMVEWPERAPQLFQENTVHVFIRSISKTERNIEIRVPF